MKKLIGITVNGIEEECRWNNLTPCPRHKIHKGQKRSSKTVSIIDVADDGIINNPMDVFDFELEPVGPSRALYHLEVKGIRTGKYILCKNNEGCNYSKHITDKEYRQLQFNLDDSVGLTDLKKIVELPTFAQVAEVFVAYKAYNSVLKNSSYDNRNVVLPEGLTETIAALCLGGKRIKKMSGDIMLDDGSIGEVKGSSSVGPNSFGPNEWFDRLIYVKYDLDNTFEVYDLNLNRSDIDNIEVKKGQTFKEQAAAGRRPRFSIDKKIVHKENLEPNFRVIFDGNQFKVMP